jgi:hypothetical protein
MEKVRSTERKKEIFQNRKQKKSDDKVRLIFTYNDGNPPIHQWLRECQKLLVKNEKAKEIGERIQIGFKQPRNIQSFARSHCKNERGGGQADSPNPGCFKCKKCHACPILKEGKEFASKNTGKSYKLRQNVTCDSKYVIYLASCKKCGGQYVGKTQNKFKQRHSGHKQEIKRNYGGLGHHYGEKGGGCGYENVSIMIIEQVFPQTVTQLDEREIFWQNQLRVYVEHGGNAHCYRKEKNKK